MRSPTSGQLCEMRMESRWHLDRARPEPNEPTRNRPICDQFVGAPPPHDSRQARALGRLTPYAPAIAPPRRLSLMQPWRL